jgi:hypothetical protein
MRLLSLSLLLLASSAAAQSAPSVDCDAVKNYTVPVELTYHAQDATTTVVQTYRDKSGDDVVWTRQTPPSTQAKQPVSVAKATYVDGLIVLGELSTTYAGKYSHQTGKYAPEGLPKNFDHRSDLTYKMHTATTDGDGTTAEKTSTISHKFQSEETVTIGSCVFQMIHGEIDTTNDAGRTRHTFQLYFPELRITAWATDAEPIVDGLSTVISEIKPVN